MRKARKEKGHGVRRVAILFGLSLFAAFLFYGTTLQNGFVHDDIGQVVRNEHVQSFSHLPKVVTSCIWKFELGDCITYYRPMQSLSYLLTYQISSNPFVFHLVQLLYFAAAVFTVFSLVYILSKHVLLALLSSLFFLIHPINTEAVNWISSLPDIAYTLFVALAFSFYVSYVRSLKKVSLGERNLKTAYRKFFESLRSFSRARLLQLAKDHRKLLFVSLCYFLAMLSKEPAILLPLLFLFFDAFITKIPWRGFLHPAFAGRYILFGIPLLLYGAMRMAVLEGFGSGSGYYGTFSLAERVYAFVTLFGQYLGKFFMPYPLNFYYPFAKSSNFLSPVFLLSLFALIAFAAFFVWTLKTRRHLVGLFLLWFLVFLSPVLVALNSVGENVFSERYLFGPSVGFAFLLAYGFVQALQFKKNIYQKYAIGAVIVLTAVSWAVVFERNKDWKDDLALYTKTLEQNPRAYAIQRNLAVELTEKERYEEAIEQLQAIVSSNPGWADIAKVYNNLGDVYRLQGDYEKALEAYEKSAEVSGNKDYRAFNNMGAVRFEQGEYLRSLLSLCKAVQLDPAASEVQRNLERLLPMFQSVKEENLHLLVKDITQREIFAKREGGVETKSAECTDSECTIAFQARLRDQEILFPFLILGSVGDGSSFRPEQSSFDQKEGVITLTIDKKYEGERVSFIFPSCEQVFYETSANL
ncbi:MAG TPA: tetratricopeptide repeat protein [Candidatus Paceibacterota bacterium]